MTKEEMKQEAEDWLNKWELCNKCENKVDCISNFSYCKKVVLQAYLAGAEPREKRIAELEARCNELFLQTCGQAKKIKELEAQIDKMKCCYNCKHSRTEYEHCKTDKHEKWEIKEND